MRNPFRSEAAAFRFLLLTLAALSVLTAAAILGGARTAVLLSAAVTVVAIALSARRGKRRRLLRTAPAHHGPPHERRLLLLAQEPPPDGVLGEIRDRADRVMVVSATAAAPLRRWASDVDGASEQARRRVEETVSRLRSLNVEAAGTVGDCDPLQAIEDALRTFGGDEIVVSTSGRAHDAAVAARIRARFALPVTHLVT